MDQHRTHDKRRWLQFSLRTLLVAMLVTAAFFGGRTPVLRELEATREKMAATERRAAEAIMQAKTAQEESHMRMLEAEVKRVEFEHAVHELEARLIRSQAERALAERRMKSAASQLEEQAAAESAP